MAHVGQRARLRSASELADLEICSHPESLQPVILSTLLVHVPMPRSRALRLGQWPAVVAPAAIALLMQLSGVQAQEEPQANGEQAFFEEGTRRYVRLACSPP